ncbi:hypothetical protein E4U40_001014 [Claviceps sp. LM458 group G5]|nr:hypothetical protein E4U40_001014 [Claviceps sp. LM458 group G5]
MSPDLTIQNRSLDFDFLIEMVCMKLASFVVVAERNCRPIPHFLLIAQLINAWHNMDSTNIISICVATYANIGVGEVRAACDCPREDSAGRVGIDFGARDVSHLVGILVEVCKSKSGEAEEDEAGSHDVGK